MKRLTRLFVNEHMVKVANVFLLPFNKKIYVEMHVNPFKCHPDDEMHEMVRLCKKKGLDFQQSYDEVEDTFEQNARIVHGWQSYFREVWKKETEKEKEK